MLAHVLVPLDGSKLAEKAINYARQIVKKGGKITLLSVLDIPEYPIYGYYPTPIILDESDFQKAVSELKPKIQEYLEHVAALLAHDDIQPIIDIVVGEPANTIIDKAEALSVDAIVMSTHGRSGFSRWLFGSVTSKVLSAASCPVFVVPGAKAAEETKAEPSETVTA